MNDSDAPGGPADASGAGTGSAASEAKGAGNPGPETARPSEETIRIRILAGCLGHPAGQEIEVDASDPEVGALVERGMVKLL